MQKWHSEGFAATVRFPLVESIYINRTLNQSVEDVLLGSSVMPSTPIEPSANNAVISCLLGESTHPGGG